VILDDNVEIARVLVGGQYKSPCEANSFHDDASTQASF